MFKLACLFCLLFVIPVNGDDAPRPIKTSSGKGQVYIFAISSDFMEHDAFVGDESYSFSEAAVNSYIDRVHKDMPDARVEVITPLNWKKLQKIYNEIQTGDYRKADIFFLAHGNRSGNNFNLIFDDPVDADPSKWGNPGIPTEFYLLTCNAGAAIRCLPKARQIYFASPEHLGTLQGHFCTNLTSIARDKRPLPDTPFEYWKRADELSLKSNFENVRLFGKLGEITPGTGCVVDGKTFGAVLEETSPMYETERRRKIQPVVEPHH